MNVDTLYKRKYEKANRKATSPTAETSLGG